MKITIEESIENLKYLISGDCTGNQMDFVEEIEMAINALEKQNPQFVLCPKGWEGVRQTRYYCPSCKGMTREHEKFCHKCGQAVKYPKLARSNNKLVLDWSDTK